MSHILWRSRRAQGSAQEPGPCAEHGAERGTSRLLRLVGIPSPPRLPVLSCRRVRPPSELSRTPPGLLTPPPSESAALAETTWLIPGPYGPGQEKLGEVCAPWP